MTPVESQRSPTAAAWWLILCLVGLDYFSTLAYLPSLSIQAAGALAPVAAVIVALTTIGVATPVYCYVVARSPEGTGATGLLERLVPGWRGKFLILLLLSFVATDYVVTQNLSIADAAEHLRANPAFQTHVQPALTRMLQADPWWNNPWWLWASRKVDSQLLVTLVLLLASFALWAFWRAGSAQRFLIAAAVIVMGYMTLNAIILASGLIDLARAGRPLVDRWQSELLAEIGTVRSAETAWQNWARLIWHGLVAFPFVSLGLSGFELSMAVAPMVYGGTGDPAAILRRRVQRTQRLLITAALVMAVFLPCAIFLAAVLLPPQALHNSGPAVHRALAYLAHGGLLADGRMASAVNPIFGATFGNLYDAFTIAILCMAGACVVIALREYVPDYLQRLGMELEIAHRLGVKMRFFNLIVLLVGLWFGASIFRMQWAYVTSVLTLLAAASLAALLSIRQERRTLWLKLPLALGAMAFFLGMALLCAGINAAGLEIALTFALGIVLTSAFSRWFRSTELRWQGFDFDRDSSRTRWEQCCALEFQILVPHRPGMHSRLEKERAMRTLHRLDPQTPIILVEVELGDPSEFYQRPLLRVFREEGIDVIQVSRCASVSHVLAAIALEMSRIGRPVELHCGWSDESPVAANLNFLLFGEGNVPWMVRELIRKAEPDPARRPLVILG